MTRAFVLVALLLLGAAAPRDDERVFMVGSFERIRVDGPYQVRVVDGASPAARAIGDRRSLENVSVRVSGSLLVVAPGTRGWEESNSVARLPLVEIVAPRLRAVTVNGGANIAVASMEAQQVGLGVNGAGTVSVDRVDAQRLQVTLIGTGSVKISGTAREARITSNGAGSVDARGLRADEAQIFAQSTGPIAIQARYLANVTASASGTVTISGGAKCIVSGPCPVQCAGQFQRRR